jgi:hypothetical protein
MMKTHRKLRLAAPDLPLGVPMLLLPNRVALIKKFPAMNVRSEIEEFSKKIDRLNDSMLLDSQYDRFIAEKRYLISDLKELKKEIDELFEKQHICRIRL